MPTATSHAQPTKPNLAVLTFDTYETTFSVAYPIMKARGLVGTFFVDFEKLDTPSEPTTENLIELKSSGWEIAIYAGGGVSGGNMLSLQKQNLVAAYRRLIELKSVAMSKGFPVVSIAAMQRSWSPELRNMARDIFDNVRVADLINQRQSFLPSDPLYVRKGSTLSLGVDDTAASLSDGIDQIQGIGIRVIHQVGADHDPLYSVSTHDFSAMCDRIEYRISDGTLLNMTFADALRF